MILNDDAKRWHRLWSVRLTLFWAALNGAVVSIPFFEGYVNPWILLGLNVLGFAMIGVARVYKQPGLK